MFSATFGDRIRDIIMDDIGADTLLNIFACIKMQVKSARLQLSLTEIPLNSLNPYLISSIPRLLSYLENSRALN